jgi:acetylornithine deacetylase/succinyl-diaminopimelate desuccinylase-like protein
MTTSAGYDPAAEVVGICSDLIAIDTSNYGDEPGPGERKAAEHVAQLLDEVGIDSDVVESEPGRTSLVARWGGDTGEPVLLHGHLDVVPAAADDWAVHPFSGEVRDGVVWGRGAVDMKDFDAMLLSSVRARARAGVAPSRPLVLCFTADEEAGGAKGAGHLARHHRDLLEDCTVAIGEVGGFSTTVRGRRLYLIEAAEKGMAWMRMTARGNAGHGSMRHPDNAVTNLAGAVARIGQHEWPVRLTPTMQVLLAAVAELAGTEATPANAEALVEEFGSAARMLSAVIRNTANPTMFDAGYKVNVVPGTATARIDGRFLPGYEDEFWATLATLAGPDVEITREVHLTGMETSYDGPVADAMTAALLAEDPDAIVAPYLFSGGTDAKHWESLGMRCFGFTPLRLPEDLDFTALFHGVDERVPVESLEFGARVFDRFLGLL